MPRNGEARARRILVAGHQEAFRQQVAHLLRGEGFEIIEVDRGRDALAWFRTKVVDVAVMEASILEVIMSTLQNSVYPPRLPLVVCPSTQDDWDGRDFLADVTVLPRPFGKGALLDVLHNSRQDAAHAENRQPEPGEHQAQRLEFFGRLAAGVVHDFNNLLTIILGAGEMLALNMPANHPLRIFVEQIQEASQKGADLVHQLKALSKNQLPHHGPVDINEAVARVQPLVRHLLGKEICLEIDLAEDLNEIEADRNQLEQVIMNLVLNARDAMPAGGVLRLSTTNLVLQRALVMNESIPPGTYVVLTVSDTGTGMDDHTLSRLFEPFFTTKEPGRGSGLGLVNVHSILTGCGGHMAVSSKVNQGTQFTLFFPRAAHAAAVRTATSASA